MGTMAKIDDSVKKKVPELRFKGFTDDWEERKLSDIADRFDNLRVPITASDRKSGDTPYYGANGIQDYVEGFTHDGEFILVAEDGANDLKNYPVQYVNGKVWVNNHAHVLQGKNTITDNKFLMNSIKNFNIEPFLVGGGRAKLNADVMMKLNILLPTFDEQDKIGSFFQQLDETIALHQRKLDLLKEQKKGYLQKMFPKNGAKVPELRFAGFADDWEQRKLSDIVSRLSKSSKNSELPRVEFEDIVSGEGRLNKDVSHKFDDRKGILFSSQNILYGKLRPYLKNWLLADFKGIALGDFWVFKSINSDPKFVYSLIQSNHYQKVANDTSGTKMPRSDWKKVSSTEFQIPSSLEEQKKIGSFFKKLDDTIALHQRKLDLLKEQKKGFLQKMFV